MWLTLPEEQNLASILHQIGKLDLEAHFWRNITTRLGDVPLFLQSDIYFYLAWSSPAQQNLNKACNQFGTALDLLIEESS